MFNPDIAPKAEVSSSEKQFRELESTYRGCVVSIESDTGIVSIQVPRKIAADANFHKKLDQIALPTAYNKTTDITDEDIIIILTPKL